MSHDFERDVLARLTKIESMLRRDLAGDILIMATLADLETQVTANRNVTQSAVLLIKGLGAQIQAAAGDPAKIAALVAELKTHETDLADAIVANTPAAPPVP